MNRILASALVLLQIICFSGCAHPPKRSAQVHAQIAPIAATAQAPEQHNFEAQNASSNLLIMYFTGGLLVVAALQAWLFLRQLKLMRESLSSATSAAKIAESTLEVMRDTAQRQLRAYLTIESAKIEFPEPGRPKSTINIKNTGQTPALDVQIWIHQWIACYPMECALPHPPDDFVMAKSTLGAGCYSHMTNEAPQPIIREPYLHLLGTTAGTVYVYGEIHYSDVFGQEHTQKYKLMYGGSEPLIPNALKPCHDGNEGD